MLFLLRREGLSIFDRAIRTLTAISCLVLAGCATDTVTRAEHAELLSVIRALRADNARLESRVEKLETDKLLGTAKPMMPRPVVESAAKPDTSSMGALPPLAVVKLKPKHEAAPKIDTTIQVAEPVETFTNLREAQQNSEPDEADLAMAEQQFDRGVEMLKTGNLEGGVAQLQQFVSDWPKHPKADNALYFAGLALHSSKDFDKAAAQFERVVAQYPAGDAVLDSMLKLADCRARLNKPKEARATWERIVANYPGTSAANQAQQRLAQASTPSTGSP